MKDQFHLRFEKWLKSMAVENTQVDAYGCYRNDHVAMLFAAWSKGLEDGEDDSWMFGGDK